MLISWAKWVRKCRRVAVSFVGRLINSLAIYYWTFIHARRCCRSRRLSFFSAPLNGRSQSSAPSRLPSIDVSLFFKWNWLFEREWIKLAQTRNAFRLKCGEHETKTQCRYGTNEPAAQRQMPHTESSHKLNCFSWMAMRCGVCVCVSMI